MIDSSALYVGRLVGGLGVGAASMLTPLYVCSTEILLFLRFQTNCLINLRSVKMHPELSEVLSLECINYSLLLGLCWVFGSTTAPYYTSKAMHHGLVMLLPWGRIMANEKLIFLFSSFTCFTNVTGNFSTRGNFSVSWISSMVGSPRQLGKGYCGFVKSFQVS